MCSTQARIIYIRTACEICHAEQKTVTAVLLGVSAGAVSGSPTFRMFYDVCDMVTNTRTAKVQWLLGYRERSLTFSSPPRLQGAPYWRQELPELHQAAV